MARPVVFTEAHLPLRIIHPSKSDVLSSLQVRFKEPSVGVQGRMVEERGRNQDCKFYIPIATLAVKCNPNSL